MSDITIYEYIHQDIHYLIFEADNSTAEYYPTVFIYTGNVFLFYPSMESVDEVKLELRENGIQNFRKIEIVGMYDDAPEKLAGQIIDEVKKTGLKNFRIIEILIEEL